MSKKKHISQELIQELAGKLENCLGRQIQSHSDCQLLVKDIQEKTERRIGLTTIRRFFGFEKTKSLPCNYTLDTLAIYAGYQSWQNILGRQEKDDSISDKKTLEWASVSANAKSISRLNLKAIKKKCGVPWDITVERNFASEYILNFLNSDKVATGFIAPGGYGKSILLAKAVEKYWINDNPVFPNDILWFIDAGALNQLLAKGFDFSEWVSSLLGLYPSMDLREYFFNNFINFNGRIILIIDGIDEVATKHNKIFDLFQSLIQLISSNNDSPWLKIILSMRNQTWHKFTNIILKYPEIQELWYGIILKSYNEDVTNLIPFTTVELKDILYKAEKHIDKKKLEILNRAILSEPYLNIVNQPIFFQILYQYATEHNELPESDIQLIIDFLKKHISSGIYGEQKQNIIEIFIKELNFGLDKNSVLKKKLLKNDFIRSYPEILEDLIQLGLFTETKTFDKFGKVSVHIRFSHKLIQDFYISISIVSGFEKVSIEVFEYVLKLYRKNDSNIDIIKWLIKIAFFEKEYDLIFNLKDIFGEIFENHFNNKANNNNECWQIVETIGLHLRNDEKARKNLIPRFAKDSDWQKYFFQIFVDFDYLMLYYGEALELFVKYNKTLDGMLFCHSLLLYRAIHGNNYEQAAIEQKTLESLLKEAANHELSPTYIARALSYQLFYYYICYNSIPKRLIEQISFFEKIIRKFSQFKEEFPSFYAILIPGFGFSDMYDHVLRYWAIINADFIKTITDTVYPIIDHAKIYVGFAYHSKNKKIEANKIIEDTKAIFFKTTRYSYWLSYANLKIQMLLGEGKNIEAYELALAAKDISEKFGWKLAENILANVLNSIRIDDKIILDTNLINKINLIKNDYFNGSSQIALNALNIFFEEIEKHPEQDNLWFRNIADVLINTKPTMAAVKNIINYSYYEFIKSRQNKIRFIRDDIKLWLARASEEVIEMAYFNLSRSFDFHKILTFSFSSLVIKFLEYTKKHGNHFQVIIAESKIIEIDYSSKLKSVLESLNIDSKIIPLNEISTQIDDISFCISGADCFDNNNNAVNGTPSKKAAMACKKMNIPYYILAESYKRTNTLTTESGFDLIKSQYVSNIFTDEFNWS